MNRILGIDNVKTLKDVFFHIPFHPSRPHSKIKQAWRDSVASPTGKVELNQITTDEGRPLPVGRFIMCYHTAPNLDNLFSYRNISKRTGPRVSAYLALTLAVPPAALKEGFGVL